MVSRSGANFRQSGGVSVRSWQRRCEGFVRGPTSNFQHPSECDRLSILQPSCRLFGSLRGCFGRSADALDAPRVLWTLRGCFGRVIGALDAFTTPMNAFTKLRNAPRVRWNAFTRGGNASWALWTRLRGRGTHLRGRRTRLRDRGTRLRRFGRVLDPNECVVVLAGCRFPPGDRTRAGRAGLP
jgi:hypothetical protein